MFCENCGREIDDLSIKCPFCGHQVKEVKDAPTTKIKVIKKSGKNDTLGTIAKAFMLLSCIYKGLLIIPLLWMVPITKKVWRKHNAYEEMGIGLKICSLVFVNPIAGILLLCRNEADKY